MILAMFRDGRKAARSRKLRLYVIIYVITRLIYSLSLTVTFVMTLLMTSTSHDVQRLVTSLDRDVLTRLTRDAGDVMARGERSLLSDASQQRDMWRHDVTACQRHVSQLTAHVSRLTSGDTWKRLDTKQLSGSPLCLLQLSLAYLYV